MVRSTKKQKAGRLVLSDDKIKEFLASNITANTYEKNEKYFKGIPEYILQNSSITKLSSAATDHSLYGLVYKLTLKDSVPSPLVNLHIAEDMPKHGNFGKSTCSANTFFRNKCFTGVRTFLLKLSFLSLLEETNLNNKGKRTTMLTEFTKEAKIQNIAYVRTYELGESVVPGCIAPAYYDLISYKGVVNPLLALLLDKAVDTDNYLESLTQNAKVRKVNQFGLILMEFAEGFQTLDSIMANPSISDDDKYKAENLAKASHMALYTKGIVQGDCHKQNVMVNLDYTGFQHGEKGKALIIDFGRAQKLDGIMEPIVENYIGIFKHINAVCNDILQTHHSAYEWIKIINDYEISSISNVLKLRARRRYKLLEKIDNSAPNIVKHDSTFSEFIDKANLNSFNHLHWKNVTSAFNLEPKVVTQHKSAPVTEHKPAPVTEHKPSPKTEHKPSPKTEPKPAQAKPKTLKNAVKLVRQKTVKTRGLVVPEKPKVQPKVVPQARWH